MSSKKAKTVRHKGERKKKIHSNKKDTQHYSTENAFTV